MADQRDGFLFYRSFYEAIHSLPKKDRLTAYEAIIEYALDGAEPALSGAPAAVFTLAKPNLDASKRKAESGKRGGQSRSKTEANSKQNGSKAEANGKQTESKPEAIKDKGQEIKDKGLEIKDEGITPVVPCGVVVSAYLDRINPSASQSSIEELTAFADEMGQEVCLRAMDIALDNKKATWSYIRGILRNWQALGVKCLADIELLDKKPEAGNQGKKLYATDYKTPEAQDRLRKDMEALEAFTRGEADG